MFRRDNPDGVGLESRCIGTLLSSSDSSELATCYGKTEGQTAHKVWNQRTFPADPAQVCYHHHMPIQFGSLFQIHVEEDLIPDGMGRPQRAAHRG